MKKNGKESREKKETLIRNECGQIKRFEIKLKIRTFLLRVYPYMNLKFVYIVKAFWAQFTTKF